MSTIDIGRSPAGPVRLDIDVLLRTRLLVQANSGGGKSWLLRRLAEQMFGKVQVVIIDPEGEFATLRERYGYVLVGKGGETPADVRSAGLVAIKLLELQAPAVCDIYEMPPAQRHQWVKVFLETLIDAPKKLWHPLVVIVDEAHVYAPERGAGESVASDAMTGLSTRGRKRGFTPIFATQRLGKLRKDVAAECANVMIGQTFIDVDRDRAADTLGVPKREQAAFFDQLRIMPAGHFFALGRALTTTRTLVTVGAVSTTHPEPGAASHAAAAPPTPDKVKHLLPKLADLPKEAEEKAKTEADLRARVRELEREVAAKPAAPAAPTPAERVEVPVLSDWEEEMLRGMDGSLQNACTTLDALAADVRSLKADAAGFRRAIEAAAARRPTPPRSVPARPEAPRAAAVKRAATNGAAPTGDRLPDGERKILTAAAQYPDGPDRAQLSILTGYKRSTRDAYIQRLVGREYVEVRGDRIIATPEGVAALGDFEPLPVGSALLAYWLDRLPDGEGRILRDVCAEHPHPRQRDAITETTGYQRSTRDAYLQRLAARRLVIPVGRGEVRAAEELFD